MKLKLSLFMMIALLIFTPIVGAEEKSGNNMSRGEFFNYVVKSLGVEDVNMDIALPKDVNGQSPYAKAVRVLMDKGIVKGYTDGTVRVNQKITEKEAMYILARFFGVTDQNAEELLKNKFGFSLNSSNYVTLEMAKEAIGKTLFSEASAVSWMKEMTSTLSKTSSYHIDSRSHMKLSVTDEMKPSLPNVASNVSTNMKMEMDFHKEQGYYQKMSMMLPLQNVNGEQDVTIEQYILPEGLYMKMTDPITNEAKWSKMEHGLRLSFDELVKMQEQGLKMSEQLSNKFFFYRDLGTETIEGQEMQKVGLYGSIHSIKNMMTQLGSTLGENILFNNPKQIPDLSMSIGGITWINKSTNLPYKQTLNYEINYQGVENEESGTPFGDITMEVEMKYSDFDKVKGISLPEEAKNAKMSSIQSVTE